MEAQEYKCALTGLDMTPETAQLDHKTPKAKGGDDSIDNLQWILDVVNKAKGTMTNKEFFDLCNMVVSHQKKS